MKNLYTIAFLILTSVSLKAQFGPPRLISLPTDTLTAKQVIRTANVDGDGNLDIFVSGKFNNAVRYFHNLGNFTFDPPVILPGSWLELQTIETADLNSDGKPDLVSLDVWADKLFWHPNINGAFPQQILITDNLVVQFSQILCHDFNGDGHIDIVLLNHTNAILILNDGAGNFSPQQKIIAPEDETEFYDNVAGDFNNDGFIDLAITSSGFSIFLNDGTGNFTKTPGGGIAISFLLESADYNNDGLDDILMKGSHTLVHYQISPTGFSIGGAFSPNNENYQTLFSSDLDNDGDLDVLSEDNQTNAFFWYENVAGGSSWIRHTISTGFNFSSIYGVRAADLDGDGDNDLIRTSSNGDVAIYENQLVLKIADVEKKSYTIFSNPVSDFLNIKANKNSSFDLIIYDMLGKIILTKNNVTSNSKVDISTVKSGNYFVKITDKKRVETKKIVIGNF